MAWKGSIQGYGKAWNRLKEKYSAETIKNAASKWMLIGTAVMLLAVQPAAAQDLSQLTSLMNQFADLLQRIGLAVAVVGLSASGISYMAHKPRTAKSIAQNVVIGTIILLLSGAAIEYISSGL